MRLKNIASMGLIVMFGLLVSGCGKKKTAVVAPSPTPVPIEMKLSERPYISLTPRSDGHLLKLKVSGIPSYISHAEYEVVYTAVDGEMEIEKGVGDTIKEIKGGLIERDVLLGTESCTNGCKYKYDEGVTGGSVNLVLLTNDGQAVEVSAPFLLTSSVDIKKNGGFMLTDEEGGSFEVKATSSGKDFFVVIKNYGLNDNEANGIYSVFSSGDGKGKVVSISPSSVVKADKALLSGDYLLK